MSSGRFNEERNANIAQSIGETIEPAKLPKLKNKKRVKNAVISKSNVEAKKTEQQEKPSNNSTAETISSNSESPKKPKPPKKIKTKTPEIVHNGLLKYSELPLDYKPDGERFIHSGIRWREKDLDKIKNISAETGKPQWVVIKSLLQTFEATISELNEN